MGILTFISTTLVGLAWPVSIIAIVIIVKRPLLNLVPLIKKLQYKDLNIEFGEIAKEAEAVLPQAEEEMQNHMLVPIDTLRKIAEISPRAAIVEAYSSIEHEIGASIERVGLTPNKSASAKNSLAMLKEIDLLGNPIVVLLNDLIRLRNDVVHSPELKVSQLSAEKYIITANNMCNYLKSVGK